jgi:hypothetical protein
MLEPLVRPFIKDADSEEERRQKHFLVVLWYTLLAISVFVNGLRLTVPGLMKDNSVLYWQMAFSIWGWAFVSILLNLAYLYFQGLTPFLKASFILNMFLLWTWGAVIDPNAGWHFVYVLILDLCLILESDKDAALMRYLSLFLRVAAAVYVLLHVLSESGVGLDIHPLDPEYNPVAAFVVGVAPLLLNFSLVKSYAMSARNEAHLMNQSVQVVSEIAKYLANFDLDAAESLLNEDLEDLEGRSPVHESLSDLLRNLRSYKPFLPEYLFARSSNVEAPNEVIKTAMLGQSTSWDACLSVVRKLREPSYSLEAFNNDVQSAFPELQLYHVQTANASGELQRTNSTYTSGRTGNEEFQRTMGAMYSIYCLARLDIDGKEIFCYGVDDEWEPLLAPTGEHSEKRRAFHDHMNWGKLSQLMQKAGLLREIRGAERGSRLRFSNSIMPQPRRRPSKESSAQSYASFASEGSQVSKVSPTLASRTRMMEPTISMTSNSSRNNDGGVSPMAVGRAKSNLSYQSGLSSGNGSSRNGSSRHVMGHAASLKSHTSAKCSSSQTPSGPVMGHVASMKSWKSCKSQRSFPSLPVSPTASSPTSNQGGVSLQINEDRMTAMLVLTALHDIMKNSDLLPTVQKRHAPYKGFGDGDRISDHDVALAYIMENFPDLLPSFNGLEPGQRAVLIFTQSKMGFNNGWLVQGEAPPGALFSSFKRVINEGRASESDVSFYFVHWLTDLAGAEPFLHKPWPGSDKFVVKFPQKVLCAFLESFSFIDRLASNSEVQVMEEYLLDRWRALGLESEIVPEGCMLAAARLALHAQGFEAELVRALRAMAPDERDVLATEFARTGLRQQFQNGPAPLLSSPAGPALLIYYSPALLQKAGAAEVLEGLRVLVSVLRAARDLFPLTYTGDGVETFVVIRIDALKVLSPADIVGHWHLRLTSDSEAEVCAGPADADDLHAAQLNLLVNTAEVNSVHTM